MIPTRRTFPAEDASLAPAAPYMPATGSCASVAFRPALPRGVGIRPAKRLSWRIAFFCSGVLAASLSAPAQAHADELAEAQDLFGQARDLRLRGDCTSALPLFRRAFEVYPAGLGSLRNIAECEESLGHFAAARQGWVDLGRALVTNHDPKYSGWALDAEHGAERLRSVEPPAGGAKETSPVAAAETPPASSTPALHDPHHPVATRTVGWAAIAVGGASLVGAGVALIIRQQALADLPSCATTTGMCQPSQQPSTQPTLDRGHAAATLANVFGVVGLVGVTSGLVLLAIARPHSPDAALVVSNAGVFAAGRF
jgi:hypothetical protein